MAQKPITGSNDCIKPQPIKRNQAILKPGFLLCTENPQLGWGFRKAFSFEPVIKTPFDLLKHLAVWQLQVSNKKS
ncbi:hypothetical protein, partial [Escherichia coli]|uniref:hypothetical protein n=1 Tax=Escherichia coli TaxID=562 RepID=UPI001BDD7C7E